MNKVGKYAKGGVVNGQNVQRFFVGGQADKDSVRAQGTKLTNIGQAETEFNNIMGSTAKSLRDIILSKEGMQRLILASALCLGSVIRSFEISSQEKFLGLPIKTVPVGD
jgi:hypothetical protein